MITEDSILLDPDGVRLLIKSLQAVRHVVLYLTSQLDLHDLDARDFFIDCDFHITSLLHQISRGSKDVTSLHQYASIQCILVELKALLPIDHEAILLDKRLSPSLHWQLDVLSILCNGSSAHEELFHRVMSCISFGDAPQRQRLLQVLESALMSLQNPGSLVSVFDERELPTVQRKSYLSYQVRDTAISLYEAFSKILPCNCDTQHSFGARIALSTHRSPLPDPKAYNFEMVLCLGVASTKEIRKEAMIRAEASSQLTSTVKWAVDEPASKINILASRKHPGMMRVKQLCQPIRDTSTGRFKSQRLNLELLNKRLLKTLSTDDLRFPSPHTIEIISLDRLLTNGQYDLREKAKRILAVILAYTVLHLCGGPWMSPNWDRHHVVFLKAGSNMPLRPYVFAPLTDTHHQKYHDFVSSDADSDHSSIDPDDYPQHPYPELVSLGTLLLEIFFGETIETLAEKQEVEHEDDNINAKWSTAQAVFRSTASDLPNLYRNAVGACLDTKFGQDIGEDVVDIHNEDLRQLIYHKIVAPLEIELHQGFSEILSIDDLDNIATKMDVLVRDHLFEPQAIKTPLQHNLYQSTSDLGVAISRQHSLPAVCRAPNDRNSFEIALICALPVEADAIHLMFDKFWKDEGRDYGRAPGDNNAYTTGVVGDHNVVLAYIPGMGKVNASAVAASMRSSYPNIKLALVVGICGAVPVRPGRKTEIFLGDLIMSTGLVQYDYGRQMPGEFLRKNTTEDNLPRPNQRISTLLEQLQTRRYRAILEDKATSYIQQISCKIDTMAYPGADKDCLYDPSYIHKHYKSPNGSACSGCDKETHEICQIAMRLTCHDVGCEKKRLIRCRIDTTTTTEDHKLALHLGRMGTGDAVIRSGLHRDRAAEEHDVIGFEMEGAGVWDQFPSIVIKGVCDYADSHKNKVWQEHAAAVAAAGMKALLAEWSVDDASATIRQFPIG